MTARDTVIEVLRHATRYSVTRTALAPPIVTNINVAPLLNTLVAITAARDAGVDTMDRTAMVVGLIDLFTRSHISQPVLSPPKKNGWTQKINHAQFLANLVEVAARHRSAVSSATWQRLVVCVTFDAAKEKVRYWRKPDGSLAYTMKAGDSKAEEVGWTAQAFNAAVLLGIPGYDAKREEAIRAAFSMPQDALPKGFNVYANAEVENHVINGVPICPHPIYQIGPHLAHEGIDRLAQVFGASQPPALFVHLPEMYAVLTERVYRIADGYLAPGGTIYRPDGALYFPAGDDHPKKSLNVMNWAHADAIISRQHHDPAVQAIALEWCRVHAQRMLEKQLAMQATMGTKWDGRAFAKADDSLWKNQRMAGQAAMTYWALTR